MRPWIYPLDQKSPTRIEKLRLQLHISADLYRAALCEFFCTAFLICVGCGASAQYVLGRGEFIDYFGHTLGWIVALFFAITIGFRSSGSHLNPAVSFFQLTIVSVIIQLSNGLALSIPHAISSDEDARERANRGESDCYSLNSSYFFAQGNISPLRFLLFILAQNLGAFVGAAITFVVYYEAISAFDGGLRSVHGPNATAGIFATYPSEHLSTLGACVDQTIATAVLCIGIGTVTDKRNHIPMFVQPVFIASHVMLIGLAQAWNAGYAINPARDFAPRLFTSIAGWGWDVFEFNDYHWFWIPVLCPMLGGSIGAWLYQAFIGFHMPDSVDDQLNYDCRPVKTMEIEEKIATHQEQFDNNGYCGSDH